MPPLRPTPLPDGEAHVWFVESDDERGEALSVSPLSLVTDDEQARHDRYKFERNRREYRITRALAREVLSRYADVAPLDWRFAPNAWGRPAICAPEGAPALRFNLTNTDGLVACIVSSRHEVGVDVEPIDRRSETTSIAHRFFSPSEVRDLFALPPEQHHARFFDYWTLKEAYIKACGMGLAIPLDHFSFHLEAARPITISFHPDRADDPAAWQFAQFRPTARHLLSAAVRRGDAGDVSFLLQRA
jgi:4'-phosphopantetheinyl transferase